MVSRVKRLQVVKTHSCSPRAKNQEEMVCVQTEEEGEDVGIRHTEVSALDQSQSEATWSKDGPLEMESESAREP